MKTGYTSVSIANLFQEAVVDGVNGTLYFGVPNPRDSSKIQALSAGPKFDESTKAILVNEFGADSDGFQGNTARCWIPEANLDNFIRWLDNDLFGDHALSEVSWSPHPELRDRMTRRYWEYFKPPLSLEDFSHLNLTRSSNNLVRQPPPDNESGGQGSQVRLFVYWTIIFPSRSILVKFIGPLARLLKKEDLSTTRGGRLEGYTFDSLGRLTRLSNNLGVEDYIP